MNLKKRIESMMVSLLIMMLVSNIERISRRGLKDDADGMKCRGRFKV